MQSKQYEIEVLVNGKPVKEYPHQDKTYVEGRAKTEFTLKLRNNSSERVVMVPSIDGVSVMDGAKAGFNSRGYIVDAYSAVTIDGWRTSLSEVAKFVFDSKGESYAQKQGNGGNQGVIGLAVFKEKADLMKQALKDFYKNNQQHCKCGGHCRHHGAFDFPTQPPQWGGTSGTPFPPNNIPNYNITTSALNAKVSGLTTNSASNMTATNNYLSVQTSDMGTAFGETKTSAATEVTFDREDAPTMTMELFYASRSFLEEIGIQMNKAVARIESRAFHSEFCPPPKQ